MASTGFWIPTLADVVDRVSTDVDANLPGSASRLRRRVTRALAVSVAGAAYLLHKFGGDIAAEILPDCATSAGVLRWARILRIIRNVATKASGTARFSGTNGVLVPTAAVMVDDDVREYTVTTGGTVVGGVVDVVVEAVVAGVDGNAVSGVVLTLVTPITGLGSDGVVQSPGIEDGLDEESIEALRARVLERLGDPPLGGSVADYRQWTREAVSNVRTVWIGSNEPGLGHVTIRFIIEPTDGDPVNAIPSTAQVNAAQDYIGGTAAQSYEDAAAPVPTIGDRIDVREISAQAVLVEIQDLVPDTTDVRNAIVASLRAMYLQRGAPGGTLKLSQFYGAIDAAAGEVSHTLFEVDGGAPADVVIGADSFPTDGGVTFS